MVNAKSEIASKNERQIVSNILEFPKTLFFYDRLLKLNPDVRDVAVGLSSKQRKEKWNEMISVSLANPNSSVIKISISTSRQSDAEQLAKKTVRTLFDTSALYYDIRNDVDFRIVDGSISEKKSVNFAWLFVCSIVFGFGISRLLQFLIFDNKNFSFKKPDLFVSNSFFDPKKISGMFVKKELKSLDDLYENEQADESFHFQQKTKEDQDAEKFQEMKKLTKQMEPEKYPNFPEMPVRTEKKFSVPENLPIADETFFSDNITQEIIVEEENILLENEERAEPTPEELKKRLNELLKGKI